MIIPRFDRTASGKRLHHFEEFNQLLGRYSGDDKYDGDYEEMGQFILQTDYCVPAEAYKLFLRILVCLLVGNTDAHFKNFAMFNTQEGLRLTPAYDLVASAVYPEYQSIALQVCGTRNLQLGKFEPRHILKMCKGFGIKQEMIPAIITMLESRLPNALTAIEKSDIGTGLLKDQLIRKIEKRWNGSFASTGQLLLKRQSNGEKNKS